MIDSPSICADGVWKEFHRGRRPDSLAELLPRLLRRRAPREDSRFWALRDVSFVVRPGQVLGIIGPNGAGKSTILKLLTRIMEPTRGRIAMPGRVGALIELAAGFHPELTGRENVFLQGAIMGMKRREILRRFDEIVEFAGIESFIDTQVKRYSSGMHARLGFSIAAHLDPDALLIDEVLSVGDYGFQVRAFRRLQEVVQGGVPVVVISHQLERIVRFANEAILMRDGAIAFHGRPEDCVQAYVEGVTGADSAEDVPVRLDSMSSVREGPVAAGGRMRFRLDGAVTGNGDAGQAAVGVRLWALPDEHIVTAVSTRAFRLDLPDRGPFHLDIDLDMNVGPGLYRVQAVVWRMPGGTEWARGPSVVVRVDHGEPATLGPAWLAPRMRLVPGEPGSRGPDQDI